MCQSTMSTDASMPSRAPAARTTVRMAWATRPRRPMTLPMSSGATCSESITLAPPVGGVDLHRVDVVDDLLGDVLEDVARNGARHPVEVVVLVVAAGVRVDLGAVGGVTHLAALAVVNSSQAPEIFRILATVSVGWAPWLSHFTALALSTLMPDGSSRGS